MKSDLTVRVAVCDSQPFLRRGISATLEREPGITVVAETEDLTGLIPIVGPSGPQVALLDYRLNADELPHSAPPCFPSVVVIANDLNPDQLINLLQGEVRGVVHRAGCLDDLIRAVRYVASGGRFVGPEFVEKLLEVLSAEPPLRHPFDDRRLGNLTSRETEVLRLVCEGRSNREIAKALWMTEKTVKFHVSNLLAKMGSRSRCELIATVAAFRR